MGFFSDLFKEEENWSYEELSALSATLKAMASADGVIDKIETETLVTAVRKLDEGKKIKNWKEFEDDNLSTPPLEHFKVLENMHTTKRKLVVTLLAAVGMADGENHPKEEVFFQKIRRILGA